MKIGRLVRKVMDKNRDEPLNNLVENRQLMISIFYQVDASWEGGTPSPFSNLFFPYEDEIMKRYRDMGASEDFITHCYPDAPISGTLANRPIILYSPGMGMDRDLYLFNITQLVKEGYILVTVGSTYETLYTVFPDEGVIYQSDIVRTIPPNDSAWQRKLVDIRVADLSCVIDALSDWNESDSVLKQKFNLSSIGAIGHSLGGTAVFELAKKDPRIGAGVILDGSLHLISYGQSVPTPFLSVRQHYSSYEEMKEIWNADGAEVFSLGQRALFDSLTGKKYFLKIHGANHISFTDAPILFTRKIEAVKPIHDSINELTIAFFNGCLMDKSQEFPEKISTLTKAGLISLINRDGEVS
ncbi:alpha/beta hydrolase family protein [Pseudoneobacillus sp. C159]